MNTVINQINETINQVGGNNPHTLALIKGEVVRVTTLKNYPFSSIQYLEDNAKEIIREILFEEGLSNGLHPNAILSMHYADTSL